MRSANTFLSGASVALLASCGDATAPASPAGDYTLRTVNGAPLPAAVVVTSNVYAVTSSALTLRADGTWSARSVVQFTCSPINAGCRNAVDTTTAAGVWRGSGPVLAFEVTSYDGYAGAIFSGAVTFTADGTLTGPIGGNQGPNGGPSVAVYTR